MQSTLGLLKTHGSIPFIFSLKLYHYVSVNFRSMHALAKPTLGPTQGKYPVFVAMLAAFVR